MRRVSGRFGTRLLARGGLLASLLLAACTTLDHPYDRWSGMNVRPPQGSYRKTCRSVRVDGHDLKARCQRDDATWRDTRLDLRTCERNVRNVDGHLRCGDWKPKAGYQSPGVPRGSYQHTCTRIRVHKRHLTADCRTRMGAWRSTRVATDACKKFANDDGHLVCE
jgi:hypothetical protein